MKFYLCQVRSASVRAMQLPAVIHQKLPEYSGDYPRGKSDPRGMLYELKSVSGSIHCHLRAYDRDEAKGLVLLQYPGAKFFR